MSRRREIKSGRVGTGGTNDGVGNRCGLSCKFEIIFRQT